MPRASVRPAAAADALEPGVVVHVEAGAEDDRVDLALDAVDGDDRALPDLRIPSVTTSALGWASAG